MLSAVGSCRIVRNSFGDVIPVLLLALFVIHRHKGVIELRSPKGLTEIRRKNGQK